MEPKHEPHPAVAEIEKNHRQGGVFVLEDEIAAWEAAQAEKEDAPEVQESPEVKKGK